MIGRRDFRPAFKRRVLEGAWALLNATSIDTTFVRHRNISGATILMYHAVTDDENRQWTDPRFSIRVTQFEDHVRYLARNRRVVSISALIDMINAGITPDAGTVAITFDDGYLDTLRLAAPILKRYGLPASVYIVSGWVETVPGPWADLLYSAINYRRGNRIVLENQTFDLQSREAAVDALEHLGRRFIAATPIERDLLWDKVLSQLSPDALPPRLLMSWAEIGDWLDLGSGYEVGLHTKTHSALTIFGTAAQVQDELDHGVAALSSRFSIANPHFSYPYGRASAMTTEVLRASGCRSALETEPLQRVTADSDPFRLSRQSAPHRAHHLGFLTSGAYPELSQKIFRRQ